MAPVKDRVKKHREELKKDPKKWEEFKKKERERDKLRRLKMKEKLNANPSLKKIVQRKTKDRVSAHRERKKNLRNEISVANETVSPIGSYKCSQSFGKAVKRVKRSLPISPHKSAAVLKKLVVEVIGPDVLVTTPPRKTPSKLISEKEKSCVRDFFCRDDISRQAPGIKDVKIVRKKGEQKKKIQKRFLLMTVGEAFSEYKNSFPEAKFGKSTFFSLRPDHVLVMSDTPHDVCVCKYHYNFIALLEVLHKEYPSVPNDHKKLIDNLCCKKMNEPCMYGICDKCPGHYLNDLSLKMDLSKQAFWKQWEDDASGRPVLREHSGTYRNVLEHVNLQLPKFKKHCFVKKVQSDFFQRQKEELSGGEIVMQMDYAENYALINQDEIQSAHWSHDQVTLFTCCVWFPDKHCSSYVVVSNDKSHSKYSVYTFMKTLIEDVRSTFPQLTKIYMFTDNCAQQFKSRYTLSNLCFFESDFNLEIEWNFFSSSHGKGAMDGIGGTVKRSVWNAVKSRTVLIDSAKTFHEYVDKSFNTKIKALYIDKEDVEKYVPLLDKRWNKVEAIPKIQTCHHFRPYNTIDLLVAKTVSSLMTRVCVFKQEEEEQVKKRLKFSDVYTDSDLSDCEAAIDNTPEVLCRPIDVDEVVSIKDFVVVVYEGELFPGQVTEVKVENDKHHYKIQCMTKSGPNWKWPSPVDEMFYFRHDIIKIIHSSLIIPVSNRGVFKVAESILEERWKKIDAGSK